MEHINPKRILIDTLQNHYEIRSIRGSDIIALNSKAVLYVRSSKNLGSTKNLIGKFWFGVTKSEYEKYCDQNFFIACVCTLGADEMDYLIFPSERFDEIKKEIELQSGQWKFNLLKTNEKRYFLQIPRKGKYDVTEFLNYFDFSPIEFRKIYSPPLGELQPKAVKEEAPPAAKKPMSLEEELILASRDSANPKNFELALEKFFTQLGFRCSRIGGSGETDVLVTEPVRFIVDGKSTKSGSKASINFTRIKRHMGKNNADFMVIVSVGFDPAVGRDAELERACLIDTQALIELLKIHQEFVLSPFEYLEIFKLTGIINWDKISQFKHKYEQQNESILKALILIENMDFRGRTIDEIKGRLDLYCEQRNLIKLGKNEIIKYLSFFSADVLNLVSCEDGNYSLRYTPKVAKNRLRTVIRTLCTNITESCMIPIIYPMKYGAKFIEHLIRFQMNAERRS